MNKNKLVTRLGNQTKIIRTSNSAYLPIIREISFEREKLEKLPHISYLGGRPMHRTTFTFGPKGKRQSSNSIYTYFFKGDHKLDGVKRPSSYPSLFTSQWNYGVNNKTYLKTVTKEIYSNKSIDNVTLKNSSRKNQLNNSNGLQMRKILNYKEPNSSYETTYHLTHPKCFKNSNCFPKYKKKLVLYDILTGEPRRSKEEGNFKRVSGNKVLCQMRNAETQSNNFLG